MEQQSNMWVSAEPDEAQLAVVARLAADQLEDDAELASLVQFAAHLCGARAAQICLIEQDRQRLLLNRGLDLPEILHHQSFYAHAMHRTELMEVCDALHHETFAKDPLVCGPPNIRYYAGQPLVSDEGVSLGTLCVIDTVPRSEGLDVVQREGLRVLAQAVMRRLMAHRETLEATQAVAQRDEQLRALADSMPAIVWTADAQGRFNYFNKGLVDLIGGDDRTEAAFHPDDWERFDTARKHSLETGETYEVEHRLQQRDGKYRWMLSRAIPVRDASGAIVRWFGTAVDIDTVHNLSERRDLLSKELSHRIKNIFAVVVGLISLQARKEPDHRAFADTLIGTLRALSRAHDFVQPAGGSTRESLTGLLAVLLAPYGTDRVLVTGEDANISQRSATPLALVFHELATNSAKYGALSVETGQITVDIHDEGETVRIVWRERGGPEPDIGPDVDSSGFGSRLVEMSVTGQLGGSWERRFEPEGLIVELTVSTAAIAP